MVQIWRRRWEFQIRSPRLVGTCVFLAVAAVLLFIAGRLREDARRFGVESIEAPVVATRFIPAVGETGTVFEVTYRPAAADAGPDRTESVPLALWEAARNEGRVRLKRAPGGVEIWRPASRATTVILAAVGAAMLLTALAIAIPGIRAFLRARQGLPPRPSFSDRVLSRVSFWTLFGSIWLTVGLPFLLMTAFFAWQDWRLSTSGQTVNGLVLEKEVTRSGKTPSGPTFRHSVRYRFESADGRVHEGTSEVSEAAWSALVERQPVLIEHMSGWTSLNRVAGAHGRLELAIFGGVGLIVTGAGALIIRSDWRRQRRILRLQLTGVRALAKVVSVEASGLRINRERLWTIRYEYADREHRRRQGSTHVTAEEAEQWKAGDTAAILVDPAAPRSTVWIGQATESPA